MKIRITSLLVLLARCVSLHAAETKPNIVYFLVDDMGYADAGFNGSKDIKTPNLDSLAKRGAVLDAFYVQPCCSPTRAVLLTGRYPTHTGVFAIFGPKERAGLPLAERTLADALREAGYTTAICGKWHLGDFDPAYTPTQRGFDHQYGLWGGSMNYHTHVKQGWHDWYRNDRPLKEDGYSTHLLAKDASHLIEAQPNGKPLFLYLPFNAVHSPYQVPDSYKQPYAALSKHRQTMAALVSSVDEAVGQVVAALTKKGILDNTLILFSSDNGGVAVGKYTDNTPLRAGKGTIYEGGVRVCALAGWPGKIPAGIRIKEPIHGIDWYPTLVRLAGGSLAQELPVDGKDIWPVLTQGAKSPHDALLLAGYSTDQIAVRMGDWKLLLNASDDDAEDGGKNVKATGKIELYNVANDISERTNLATTNPDKVRELKTRLNEFMQTSVKPIRVKRAK
jgi:arylsulfatase A-like enzyme